MKKTILTAAFAFITLVACQNTAENKETTEDKEAAKTEIIEMEEEATKLEETKTEIDETSAELDSLIKNL